MRKVLVMEDETNIRSFVVINLKRAGYETIEAGNGEEALEQIRKNPDIKVALLDIMMPGVSGLDAAAEIRLRDETADIVFLTSSPGFAYESYGVRALDYLLKPVQKERLREHLDRLQLRAQKPAEGLTVKCGTTLVRVLFSQLSYVEVNGKHIYFNMTDGTVHEVFGTLREFEPQLLQRQEFVRCHRSYIVNLLQVAELSAAEIRTFTGKTLPVSRSLYKDVQNKYMKVLFSEGEGEEG